MTKEHQVWILAYSQRLAWGFKLGISALLTGLIVLWTKSEDNLNTFLIFFPLIGLLADSILYWKRNSFFKKNPKITEQDVLKEYKLNPEELFNFAKNFPKVRFLRLIPGIIFIPIFASFISEIPVFATCIATPLVIYFPAMFLDSFWAKKLKIKLPAFYNLQRFSGFTAQKHTSSFQRSLEDDYATKLFTGQFGHDRRHR